MQARDSKTASIFAAAVALSAVPAMAFVHKAGASDAALLEVLRTSARIALILYLVVFVARPLRRLLPSPSTTALLRNRRYVGVALAGVMTTHLVFIAWRWIVMDLPLTARLIVAGGGAYALLYLMLLTSFDRPAKALGPARWRRLHKTGLYWLGFVFATTVAARVMREPGNWLFITEALLFGAAVVLRLLAFARRQRTAATDSAR